MANFDRNCSLYGKPLQYYCQTCEQPICQQSTILGPHHTPLHVIMPIASAYERKVNEVKERITAVLARKGAVVDSIGVLNLEMEEIRKITELSVDENEQHRGRMLKEIEKSHDRMVNELNLLKEELEDKLNEVNDLGHSFETIDSDIEVLASHSNILQSMKDCMDRLSILLEKEHPLPELPKQLSDLRWDLKSIEVYKGLIQQKQRVLHELLTRLDAEKAKLARPVVDYGSLLGELSQNMEQSITHNVCYYCGQVFTVAAANTPCPKNNSTLSIGEFQGYTSFKPDSSKWATQRHFFAPPADPLSYYHSAEKNSFGLELRALLLKLKTIVVSRKIQVGRKFQEADRRKGGTLNRIEMMYVLREVCGLTQQESQIILTQCRQPQANHYVYGDVLEKLNPIEI